MTDIDVGISPVVKTDPRDVCREIEEELAETCGGLNVLHGRMVRLAARALATGAWAQIGIRSPEHWLSWQTGLSPERARDVMALARRVAELPVTVGTLNDGELAIDQAIVVAKHGRTHNDRELADLAKVATVGQLRSTVRRYVFAEPDPSVDAAASGGDLSTPDSGHTEDPALARARCTTAYRDGRYRLMYDAPVDVGALVEKALVEAKDHLFQAGQPDVTLGEAFGEVFNRSLQTVADQGPSSRVDRFKVYIHLGTDGAWVNAGPAIPPSLLSRITCDGVVKPVWETNGHAVNVGRSQRIVPQRTRRLIEDRDRGCRFPGCNATRYVEIHHITHWMHGGRTDTDGLISLCPFHHDGHHRGEFTIAGDADDQGSVVFRNADGRVIERSARPQPPTGPLPRPPDGKTYRHPLGERIDYRWLWLSPSPCSRDGPALN